MEHKVYCVISFENVCPYALKVTFDDGTSQVIDFRPVLAGEIYGPLQDEKFFNQVEIDPEVHTLVWPSGADFGPATLHNWDDYIDDLKKMAKRWGKVEV
jgi:hypothetical protein